MSDKKKETEINLIKEVNLKFTFDKWEQLLNERNMTYQSESVPSEK